MSHGKLREDKNCQNCGSIVEDRYCSHCGQENTETRQRFHFLITHFIEDFAHYDSSFWSTIKNLFLKPGFATQEYLSGKRTSTVNPVKLYIFVSFITFLGLALFPSKNHSDSFISIKKDENIDQVKHVLDSLKTKEVLTANDLKLIQDNLSDSLKLEREKIELERDLEDEISIFKPLIKKDFELRHNGMSIESQSELFKSKIFSMLPKGLFIYMPIFAFVLWLFYNKKKWWYFDHGIFTLHYFSLLLLSILFMSILSRISDWINVEILGFIISIFNFILSLYLIVNFYLGCYRLYQETKLVTFIKGSIVLFINSIILGIILVGIGIYSFLHLK